MTKLSPLGQRITAHTRPIEQRLAIAERDINTLRDKIARLAERDTCDDCHNHMPGLNRSQQQLP